MYISLPLFNSVLHTTHTQKKAFSHLFGWILACNNMHFWSGSYEIYQFMLSHISLMPRGWYWSKKSAVGVIFLHPLSLSLSLSFFQYNKNVLIARIPMYIVYSAHTFTHARVVKNRINFTFFYPNLADIHFVKSKMKTITGRLLSNTQLNGTPIIGTWY